MNPTIKARIESIRRGEVPEGYKRTKIGIVPNEWKKVRLGDYLVKHKEVSEYNNQYPVLTSSRRGIFLQSDYYKQEVASEDNTGYNVVPKGYFTYRHMSDDNIFKFNINTIVEKGIVSTLYPVFTTRGICDDFLLVLLNNGREFSRFAILQKQGGSRTYIYFDKLQELKIWLPSIYEQEKIAEILAGQDQVIALKEQLLEEKQKQKKYLMQQLLTGKKRLPGFSGEWKTDFLGNVCDNLDNLRKPFNRDERAIMKGIYPYYGANGIVDYIDRYIFDEMIILLAEDGGDFENYFKKPIAQKVIGKCWVNNHAHVLRAKKEYCSEFIFYLLEHKDIRKYINGTTRSKLTKEDMQGILLYYPIDKKEQSVIAEILSTADKEIELLKKDIEQEKLKKKSLMQLLLTGIVRVDELVS